HHAKTESVAPSAMLLRILLEIAPQVLGQYVFGGNRRMRALGVRWFRVFNAILRVQNGSQFRPRRGFRKVHAVEVEFGPVTEAGDENSLTILWNQTLCIDDPVMNVVPQFSGQDLHYYVESPAAVMRPKILHVLEQKRRGPVPLDDSGHVEKQRALRIAS